MAGDLAGAHLVDARQRLGVEDKLATSGHNITPIRSIYRWQGEIEDRREARVALHTKVSLLPAIIERTKASHSYVVPGIIALPIIGGNPDYLAWIDQETTQQEL